jgi:hypothetical protein
MKYLLFIYYLEGEKTEDEIIEIAEELSPIIDSGEIKFIFGPSHAVYNFTSEMVQDELTIYVDILQEDVGEFKYILLPTPNEISSNMPKENLEHLMDIKGDINDGMETFIQLIKDFKEKVKIDSCDLTIDQILEKIKEMGVSSLTLQEKEKLDNYSQSI